MLEKSADLTIVGAGPAGLLSAIKAYNMGVRNVLLLDMEKELGGIFRYLKNIRIGEAIFGSRMSPEEFLGKLLSELERSGITTLNETTAIDLKSGILTAVNPNMGVMRIKSKIIILATGGIELNQYNLLITGDRPVGIFTALTANQLIKEFNLKLGNSIIVYGNNDVALDVALTLKVADHKEVSIISSVSKKTYSRYLLDLAKQENIEIVEGKVIEVRGHKRLESILVKDFLEEEKEYKCDTLIIAQGFYPNFELVHKAGAQIDFKEKTPILNEDFETTRSGLFVAGLAAKIYYDFERMLVDAQRVGEIVANRLLR